MERDYVEEALETQSGFGRSLIQQPELDDVGEAPDAPSPFGEARETHSRFGSHPTQLEIPHRHRHSFSNESVGYSNLVQGDLYGPTIFNNSSPVNQTSSDDEMITRCMNGLFVREYQSARDAKSDRVEGTCTWMQTQPEYKAWLESKTTAQTLLITSSPGQGKSTLAAYLCQELEKRAMSEDKVITLSFFYGEQYGHRVEDVIKCLIWQVLDKCKDLRRHLVNHQTHLSKDPNLHDLWRVFRDIFDDKSCPHAYCVLDALDESRDENVRLLIAKMVVFLDSRLNAKRSRFKLLVLGRTIGPLQQFVGSNCTSLNLDQRCANQLKRDIVLAIDSTLEKVARETGLREDDRDALGRQLKRRSEGTFLWVGCILQLIRSGKTPTQMYNLLRTTPGDLRQTYLKFLSGIPESQQRLCAKILHFVGFGYPYNRNQRLITALFEPDEIHEEHMDETCREWGSIVAEHIQLCIPFLYKIPHRDGQRDEDVEITLRHLSMREFLEDNNCPEPFKFNKEAFHFEMSRACLRHLGGLEYPEFVAVHLKVCHDLLNRQYITAEGGWLIFRPLESLPRESEMPPLTRKRVDTLTQICVNQQVIEDHLVMIHVEPWKYESSLYAVLFWALHASRAGDMAKNLLYEEFTMFEDTRRLATWMLLNLRMVDDQGRAIFPRMTDNYGEVFADNGNSISALHFAIRYIPSWTRELAIKSKSLLPSMSPITIPVKIASPPTPDEFPAIQESKSNEKFNFAIFPLEKCSDWDQPANIFAALELPDHHMMELFRTIGAKGVKVTDPLRNNIIHFLAKLPGRRDLIQSIVREFRVNPLAFNDIDQTPMYECEDRESLELLRRYRQSGQWGSDIYSEGNRRPQDENRDEVMHESMDEDKHTDEHMGHAPVEVRRDGRNGPGGPRPLTRSHPGNRLVQSGTSRRIIERRTFFVWLQERRRKLRRYMKAKEGKFIDHIEENPKVRKV